MITFTIFTVERKKKKEKEKGNEICLVLVVSPRAFCISVYLSCLVQRVADTLLPSKAFGSCFPSELFLFDLLGLVEESDHGVRFDGTVISKGELMIQLHI